MFDFDEIEEVAPASKSTTVVAGTNVAPQSPAKLESTYHQDSLQQGNSGSLLSAEDARIFEAAEDAKRRWLAAGDHSMACQAEAAGLRSAMATVREAAHDAWYDCQPEEAVRCKAQMTELTAELQEAEEAVSEAEEEERKCEEEARTAQAEASRLQKSREAELDARVLAWLRNPTGPIMQVPPVRWLPGVRGAGHARTWLFVFLGVGQSAQGCPLWVETAKRAYPGIAVCPVSVPRQGSEAGSTRGRAHDLAEAFSQEVLSPAFLGDRPFAVLGCCAGARLAYEVARRRSPLRLYVAGRAAPHVGARGQSREEAQDPVAPAEEGSEVAARLCAGAQGWGPDVVNNPLALDDLEVGWTPLAEADAAGKPLPQRLRCRIHVFEADRDTIWPPATVRMGWNLYAPTPGTRCTKRTYKGLSHSELCSGSKTPLLIDVLEDLRKLMEAAQS